MVTDSTCIQTILVNWNLGEIARTELAYTKGDKALYLITVTDGHIWVLKRLKQTMRVEMLESQHQVLEHLHRHQVPVPLSRLTNQGRCYVEHDQQLYILYPFFPAGTYGKSDDIAQIYLNIGQAIGKLHNALASYPQEIKSWRMDLVPRVFDHTIPPICQHLRPEQLPRFLAVLTDIEPMLHQALQNLSEQYIHGDCHGGNLLIHEGEVSAFIDCDHLPFGPKIYDLCYFWADTIKNSMDDVEKMATWLANFDQILKGYELESYLSSNDKAHLWPMLLIVQLFFTLYFFEANDPDLAHFNLRAFYWIYEHKTDIFQQLLNVQS